LATNAIRAAEVRVQAFSGPVDLESPEGELSANVLAAIARFEKRQTGVRVKQAMKARAHHGMHSGGAAPYGYRWEDRSLVIQADEAKIVTRIFSDYRTGAGQRGIVRALNEERVPTRHGGPWNQSSISRLLASQTYIGKLEFKGEVLP